jgi:hypothetical protein
MYEDEIWIVNSDRMKNYKVYFAHDNPSNLQFKTNLNKKADL